MAKPQRLQFGLRKLLLWTAVVALYLGCVKAMDASGDDDVTGLWTLLAIWAAGVGMARAVFGPTVAAWLSIATGASLFGLAGCVFAHTSRPPHKGVVAVWIALGGLIGVLVYTIAVLAYERRQLARQPHAARRSAMMD